MPPKPKPGHAKRRSTSPITATYLYDKPEEVPSGGCGLATATAPQTFSFDASAFATVTGVAPLADSPAAAPVARPPPTAAATPPAAAAAAPDRASKLSHLSAEDAAAEKARLIKEQVYASFIKGGMSHEDAQHFVDTMPQCLIDDAEELDSGDEEGEGDSEGDSEGGEEDSEGEEGSEGSEGSEAAEDDSERERGGGTGGKAVTLWKCVLEDDEGGKYKICDSASDHKVPSCGEYVQRMSARIGKAEHGGDAALVVSWDGAVGFRLPLRGKCTGSCLVIDLNGEVPANLNPDPNPGHNPNPNPHPNSNPNPNPNPNQVPQIPSFKEDYGSDLYAACRTATQLTLEPGGHWTREGASAAWSPLFD